MLFWRAAAPSQIIRWDPCGGGRMLMLLACGLWILLEENSRLCRFLLKVVQKNSYMKFVPEIVC